MAGHRIGHGADGSGLLGCFTAAPPHSVAGLSAVKCREDRADSMLNDWIGLILVFILVAINGFFVAAEFSLVSVRKTRIAERVAHGDTSAKAVQQAIEDPDRFIA